MLRTLYLQTSHHCGKNCRYIIRCLSPTSFFYNTLSHTTDESYREGTETLLYKIERSDTGVPEKYCAANFLGRGETNVANLKGLLANLFLLRNLFGRAGVPPTTLHSSLFTIHCVKVSFTLNPRNFPKHTEFSNALLLKICSACFYSSSVCKENNYLQLLLRFRFFFDFTVLGKEPDFSALSALNNEE